MSIEDRIPLYKLLLLHLVLLLPGALVGYGLFYALLSSSGFGAFLVTVIFYGLIYFGLGRKIEGQFKLAEQRKLRIENEEDIAQRFREKVASVQRLGEQLPEVEMKISVRSIVSAAIAFIGATNLATDPQAMIKVSEIDDQLEEIAQYLQSYLTLSQKHAERPRDGGDEALAKAKQLVVQLGDIFVNNLQQVQERDKLSSVDEVEMHTENIKRRFGVLE